MANTRSQAVALIGFGEAGAAFAQGWHGRGIVADLKAYDIKTASADETVRAGKWADYDKAEVAGCPSVAEALAGVSAVFSLVTADQANRAAVDAAPLMQPGTFFFDCNSCAPGTKRRSAETMEEHGILYVDTAVMSPVHPKLHRSPLLISGTRAEAALPVLKALDMDVRLVPGDVGRASSIKMIRSIMMKGLEALVLECVLSGRRAGVDEDVLNSLDATYPGFDWKAKAAYMFERTLAHGKRRAAEMQEVSKTVSDLGFPSAMSEATVGWQQIAGNLGIDTSRLPTDDYRQLADAILAALDEPEIGTRTDNPEMEEHS